MKFEMLLKAHQAAMGIGNKPYFDASVREFPQRRRHIVVQEEVVARCPLHVDLVRARIKPRPTSSHTLDDPSRVPDKDLGVVDVVLRLAQSRRRGQHGISESRRIDVDAVTSAKALITDALERRPWIDQREIDVEEHRLDWHTPYSTSPLYGPATTIVAWEGTSIRLAAEATASPVTARRRPGTRRS